MFKSILSAAALAAVAWFTAVPAAKADLVWTLVNVQLDDGTYVNGTFSLNVYGYLSFWDITTTGGSLSGYHYQSPPDGINASIDTPFGTAVVFNHGTPPEYLDAYNGYLTLTFANSLGLPGIDPIIGGTEGPSYECGGYGSELGDCGSNPIRFVAEGSRDLYPYAVASAVPEPSTWAMLLIGFAGLGWTLRRTRRSAKATA